MIRSTKLTNFRRFGSFSLRLGPGNILVGPNNSGKSTILDAFRILESCLRYSKSKNPSILDIPGRGAFYGYEVPSSSLPLTLANVTHDYNDFDAILEFDHTNGAKAVVLLHPERITRFFVENTTGRTATSSYFRASFPINFVNIPTLSPLEVDEKVVEEETLRRNTPTRLASRVFRNYWFHQSDKDFDEFRNDIGHTWPGIYIKKPERTGYPAFLQMFYSEGRIDREVQWSGFGFQVWMLMHTHFRRLDNNSFLIIDEPDVYLHPDLQRKLLHSIRGRCAQFALATHSIEIINEAEDHELISVDARNRTGRRVRDEADFNNLYQYIGSGSNADFARIARARKVIFVEGKDGKILKKLARKLKLSNFNNQDVPIVQLGGFSEWRRAVDAVWAFKNIIDLDIKAFCVFDRDYRCDSEVEEFIREVEKPGITVRILDRKELENYILDNNCIASAILKRREGISNKAEICKEIFNQSIDSSKEHARGQRTAAEIRWAQSKKSSEDLSTTIKRANARFDQIWAEHCGSIRVVSGKEVFTEINSKLIEARLPTITMNMVIDEPYFHVAEDLKKIISELDVFIGSPN